MGIDVKAFRSPNDDRFTISATFDEKVMLSSTATIVMREVVQKIVDRYVEENYDKIIKSVGNEAVLDAVACVVRNKFAELFQSK